ncbi:MAG: uroporphyrinogen-III C-methyltransferase [Clostridia bacterium]
MKKGFVTLIGAGPGEVSLLTVRAKELLEQAEVVLFDRLVSQDILDLIPKTAKKINVGKASSNHIVPQEQINQILLDEAIKNQIVIRLKGGDPFVFGRGGEELDLLVKNNVSFEVVPGITSAIAAPSFAGIPVTHRDFCSSVHIITGHQKKNEPLKIDFESLVKINGTLVFLMGVSSLKQITDGLLDAGIDKNMPAALIENGTRAYQRKVVSTVENIYEDATAQQFKSPSIIIVGKVCSLSDDFDWFSKRPLYGKNIIVTSPLNSNGKLHKKLKDLSANVISLPSIEIGKTISDAELFNVISNLKSYTTLVFTSKNGVQIFFDELFKNNFDTRSLSHMKIAAIGPSTASSLKSFGIVADFVPEKYQGSSLAEVIILNSEKDDNILFLRAEKGNTELVETIKQAKINFTDCKIYKSTAISNYKDQLEEICQKDVIVCFTSASTVDAFMKNNIKMQNMLAVCIGTQTAQTAKKYNLNYIVSEKATIDSMVDKILEVTR